MSKLKTLYLILSIVILNLNISLCDDDSEVLDSPRDGRLFFGENYFSKDNDNTNRSNTQTRAGAAAVAGKKKTPGSVISHLFNSFGQSLGSVIDNFMIFTSYSRKQAEENVEDPTPVKYSTCERVNAKHCYQTKTEQLECGIPNRVGRIVNGNTTEVNEYPWMAGIHVRSGKKLQLNCGGTLISDRYVVTAAHCVKPFDTRFLIVVLGDHNKQKPLEDEEKMYQVASTLSHPAYDRDSFNADIALVQLRTKVTFTRAIRPVCLPAKDQDYGESMGTVIGWGRTKWKSGHSNFLMETQVPIIPIETCRERSNYVAMEIKNNMICAGYFNGTKDACEGDSGGPLTVYSHSKQNVLVGIVSWGEGCGSKGYPGVYTRVSSFLKWIAQNTRDSCYCNESMDEEIK